MSQVSPSWLDRARTAPRALRVLAACAVPLLICVLTALGPGGLSAAHTQLLLLVGVVVAALLLGLAAGLTGATFGFGLLLWLSLEPESGGRWALSLEPTFDAFLWFAVAKLLAALIAVPHGTIRRLMEAAQRSGANARRTELLLTEQAHRIRNDLNALVGILQIQANADPVAAEALNTAARRVLILGRVHGRLSSDSDAEAVVDSRLFLEDLVADLRVGVEGLRPIALTVMAEAHPLALARAGDVGLVANELITNALKHAFPGAREGVVRVSFRRDGDLYDLTVADNGVGYAAGRASEDDQAGGLGSRILRALAAQLGGRLTVTSGEVGGTTCRLKFPVAPPEPERGLSTGPHLQVGEAKGQENQTGKRQLSR